MGAASSVRIGSPAAAARPIRLKRGEQPTPSTISGFQRWAWKTFGPRVSLKEPNLLLEENLVKAHMRVRADEFLASVYATTLLVGIVTAVVGVVLGVVFLLSGTLIIGVVLFLLPVIATPATFYGMQGTPASKA